MSIQKQKNQFWEYSDITLLKEPHFFQSIFSKNKRIIRQSSWISSHIKQNKTQFKELKKFPNLYNFKMKIIIKNKAISSIRNTLS